MHARHPSSDGHPVGAPAAAARSRPWEFSLDESLTQKATLLALAARCNFEGAKNQRGERFLRGTSAALSVTRIVRRLTSGTVSSGTMRAGLVSATASA